MSEIKVFKKKQKTKEITVVNADLLKKISQAIGLPVKEIQIIVER